MRRAPTAAKGFEPYVCRNGREVNDLDDVYVRPNGSRNCRYCERLSR